MLAISSLALTATAATAAYDELRPGAETPVQEAGQTAWRPSDEFTQIAQPFIQPETGSLSSVTLQVWDVPSGYEIASAAIHEFSPSTGPSSLPIDGGTGGAISYEALPAVALGTPIAATIAFPDRPVLTAGTHYAIVVEPLTPSGENATFVTYVHYQGDVFAEFNPWQFRSGVDAWEGYSNGLYVLFNTDLVTSFGEPTAPTRVPAATCGVDATVSIPQSEGVVYDASRTGDVIVVTASAAAGYELPSDAVTEWQFDVSAVECSGGETPSKPTPPKQVQTAAE